MTSALRTAALLCCLAAPALAQSMDTPDAAGFPDGSVGGSVPDQASPEAQDSSKVCQYDSDCEKGFSCQGQKCTYRRPGNATFMGCSSAPAETLAALGLLALVLRRR